MLNFVGQLDAFGRPACSETNACTSLEHEFVFQKISCNNMSIQLVFLYLKPDRGAQFFKRSIQAIKDILIIGMPFVLTGDATLNARNPSNASGIDYIENLLHCRQMVKETNHRF